nr:response regulator transcription factor [Vallitaleaceae bacterium]
MVQKRIYIADDEVNIRNIIQSFLIKEGNQVETFHSGKTVVAAFERKPADMLIIAVMMPGLDGYEVCRHIRSTSSVPIIIVSAKDTEQDKITGLNLGSDDYLTKPFSPMELVARVHSLFRRTEQAQVHKLEKPIIHIYDVILDNDNKRAMLGDIDIGLTCMEFNVLFYLADNGSRAVSRSELLGKVWG